MQAPNPGTQNPASRPGFAGENATGKAHPYDNAHRTDALSQPDFNDAQNFLDLIDPTASGFNFRSFNDAKDRPRDHGNKFNGTLAAVATALERDNRARRGVFVVVNGGGDTDSAISSIRAVFADTDGAPLAPILSCGLSPHIVVETSPGRWHVYWTVTGLEACDFRAIQRRIAYRFGTDRTIINPSRVMRLPGFDHHKGEPFRARTIRESGAPAFTAEQVLEAFPPLAAWPEKAKARSAGTQAAPGRVSSYADGALRRAAESVAGAAEGARNDSLNREAYSLAGIGELTDADISGALETAARAAGLSDDEINATIRSGIASGRSRPREAPQPRQRADAFGHQGEADNQDSKGADAHEEPAQPIFTNIDLGDLANAVAEPVRYCVTPLIPAGVVTLLGSHGGVGKTLLSIILAAHYAAGRPWGAFDFEEGRVLFVSLEDPGTRIRASLARVARHYHLDAVAIARNVVIIDGSGADAALAAEVQTFTAGKVLVETRAYAEMRALAAGFDLIIVDNASDAFDGNENERRQVRKFVKGLLGTIAAENSAGVLLLAHVDKSAAKFGARKNSYSGSTAWHNSARSRIAIIEDDAGGLELIHEKNNLGKKADPLPLRWTDSGMLEPSYAAPSGGFDESAGLTAGADDTAVLDALKAAIESGGTITTAKVGACNTHNMLTRHDALPGHLRKGAGKERFWAALARLQRAGRIVAEGYENAYRHQRERWAIPDEATA